MFLKKYMFETQKTKYIRYIKNMSFYSFIIAIFYLFIAFIFIQISRNEKVTTGEFFYKKVPDLIVVFTGDKGRIPLAVKLAKKYKQTKILISGVYAKNSVNSLIKPLKLAKTIDPNQWDIDYKAKNTVENIVSTLKYLKENNGHENILIVSHDYHISRIKILMSKFKNEKSISFHYMPVESNFFNLRSLRLLLQEVYKTIRAYLYLSVTDQTRLTDKTSSRDSMLPIVFRSSL